MSAHPPTLPPMEVGADTAFNPDFSNPVTGSANGHGLDGASESHMPDSEPAPAVQPLDTQKQQDTPDPKTQKEVQEVLYSDIGISTLLNRLKASIASARDFASFLKRRGALEEDHASRLKDLSHLTLQNLRKGDARHESYQRQFEQVMVANEKIGEHGNQFGLALHLMHENLLQLANKIEGSRKTWKQTGLAAEKKVKDAEALADKAKSKYDSLAEDLDRVKTGDSGAGRRFGIKGPKSAAQHEEELQRKVQAADADYLSKVQTAQGQRKELLSTHRPQAVAALLDLIKEIDAALTMEMQKFASFYEKLIVNNGQVVIPQPSKGNTAQSSSINQLIYHINNDGDFEEYILKHRSKIPSARSELKYEKHPSLAPSQSQVTTSPAAAAVRRPSVQGQTSQPPPSFQAQPRPQSTHLPTQYQPPQQSQQPVPQTNYQSYNSGYSQQPPYQHPQQSYPGASTYSPVADNPYQQLSPDQPRAPPAQQMPHQTAGIAYGGNAPPPVNPVFGVNLEDLFARDGSPVPMVVYQCIQAVDMFGLEVEGIYRIPGTASHIQAMKALFDSDSSRVDFRNPEAFQHDVNSVAGLLKQFFRELPDPLLTRAFYQQFIDAARIDDETMRRDSMHALINALPDPNYATLRALILHLHRVQQASEANRMSSANLGICWAPSVMGPHTGNNMADAGLQARVVLTILDNALQIFDED
ncbi:RhoGAP-domain-containing protein [Delitschia confertaspora ATCC 74209]|uniref:RhoGAP-domain-containing protein n=1 Tax=Delitschia confertaspora ATCC 74209 TaxID=1513339 RepID=A0A9P4N2S4_9PLEO|nr:RhoGAP-domain-containing protein [Delitschia confertaspora ATCC 74209]